MTQQSSAELEKMLLAVQQNETLKQLFSSLTADQLSRFKNCRLLVTDFDGVLTNNKVWVNEKGEEFVQCSRSESFGMKLLKTYAPEVQFLVLSTEANPVVAKRAKKMGLPCQHNLENKHTALDQAINEHKLTPQQTAYIGNDVNDLTCLEYVGLPIVVADAYPPLLTHAAYITRANGGDDAFREVCELMLLAKLGPDGN